MADNVILSTNVGVGATMRTDDLSGVHVPLTKIMLGADGTDGGFVTVANPFPVNFTNTTIAATNAGTFAVQAAQSGTWNVGTVTTVTTVTAVTAITNALPAGTN